MITRFEWNSRKAQANLRKHGMSFDDAEAAFRDPLKKLDMEGDEHGEIRWRTTGQIRGVLCVVSHTLHEEGEVEVVRVISVRRCTRRERQRYEEAP